MTSKTSPDPEIERLLRAAHQAASAPASSACLDADVLAAWADRELGAAEAARVERHLSDCARCQAVVAVFARSEPVAATVLPFWQRWPVRVLAPLATAAAAVLVWSILPARQSAPPPSQTMARVEQAPEVAPAVPPVVAPAEQPGAPADQKAKDGLAAGSPSAQRQMQQPARVDSSAESKLAGEASARTAPGAAPVAAPSPVVAAAPLPPPASPPAASQPQRLPNDATAEAPQIQAQSGERSFSRSSTQTENLPIADRSFIALGQLAPGVNGASRVGGGSANVMMDGVSTMDTAVTAVVTSPLPQGAAGGRGGRAGGGPAVVQAHWRILSSGGVQRSIDGGTTWVPTSIVPPVQVTAGAATSSSICWLVGPRGLVFLATDGLRFTRLPFPENVDLRSVRATDADRATVTATDGRTFTTLDRGQSWN